MTYHSITRSFIVFTCVITILISCASRDEIESKCAIDLTYQLSMKGYVEDVGFNDMFFEREFFLIKNREDSLLLDIERSEFQGVFLKKSTDSNGDSIFLFYNKDERKPVCVKLNSFKVVEFEGDVDTIETESVFLCGVPGTY